MVKDEEYTGLAQLYRDFSGKVEQYITAYCNILDNVAANGIKAGDAHDKLVLFKDRAAALKGVFEPLASGMAAKCESYCSNVDALDKDVY
jgi:hypothetical protein